MTAPIAAPMHHPDPIARWQDQLDHHIASLPPAVQKSERAALTKLRKSDDLVMPVHMVISQQVERGDLARRWPLGPEARFAETIKRILARARVV